MASNHLGDRWAFGRRHQSLAARASVKRTTALAASMALVLGMTSLALADNTVTDGDFVTTVPTLHNSLGDLDLGIICVEESNGGDVRVLARRNGSGVGTWNNSAVLTASQNGSPTITTAGTNDASVSVTVPASPNNQITLPTNWQTIGNNILSAPVLFNVMVTAGTNTGAFEATVPVKLVGTGTTAPSTTGQLTHDGTATVVATISDAAEDGCDGGGTNSPPEVDAGGPYSGDEGSDISIDAASATDADNDTLTYSWFKDESGLDDGGSCTLTDATTLSPTLNCNDNGTVTLTLSVDDGHNLAVTDDATVDVANVAPAFDSGKPAFASASVNCGANNATLNFGFTDAGANDTHTGTVNWGDGSGDVDLTATELANGSASHTYNSGSYTATVNISDDDDGLTGDATANLVVNFNVAGNKFLQPVNDTRNGQSPSLFKYGSTVPLKLDITNCSGGRPNNLMIRVDWWKLNGSTPYGESEATATNSPTSGNYMRFTDPNWMFNWGTKYMSDPTCTVRIQATIESTGQTVYSDIGLRK